MKRNDLLKILLWTSPCFFFIGNWLFNLMYDRYEPLQSQIIGALIIGYFTSISFWLYSRKKR